MKVPNRLLLLAGLAAFALFFVLAECSCTSLKIGKNHNLGQVQPDYVDPPWYDDYQRDRHAAYERYDDTVMQLGVRVTDVARAGGSTEVRGTTGDNDRYRASCTFSETASASLENVQAGDYIQIKGMFDHMLETTNSYQIYLEYCVIVKN